MSGVLESKGTLELAYPNAELLVLGPLSIQVHKLECGFACSLGIGALTLDTPVEFTNLSIENQTHQAQIELVMVAALLVLILILQHSIAAEADVVKNAVRRVLCIDSKSEGRHCNGK